MSQNILLSSIDKAIVAHYEAGHAVIAHCLGLAVEHVSLGSASLWGVSLAGHTRVPECLAENPAYSERCLWITLAGPAAHARYDPVGYQRGSAACARNVFSGTTNLARLRRQRQHGPKMWRARQGPIVLALC